MAGDPIQELMAMAGGGGGGGGMPPGAPPAMDAAMGQRSGGMPPGGGGGMGLGGGLGNIMAQALEKLMQNPQAMAAIGSVLSDIAGPQNDPRMQGGGQQMAMAPSNPSQMMDQATPDTGVMAPAGEEFPPMGAGIPEGATTEDEMAMVQEQMGAETGEAQWEGTKAPTAADVEMLRSDPDAYREAFDAQFGAGACEQYLEEGGEDYEADADDEGDHEYR